MNLFDTTIKTFGNTTIMMLPVEHITIYDEDLNDDIDGFACSSIHL